MFNIFRSTVFALPLFVVAASAQQDNPQKAADQKDKKVRGINTVIVVTGSKTEEPQQNITQKVGVIYDDQIAAQAPSLRESHLLRGQPSEVLALCAAHTSRRFYRPAQPGL
jgi:outer membrane receptor protein involved in Fe transport